MNVKELREALANLPDDMIVIIQKDAEGNGYSPLSGADSENASYSTRSGEVGYIELTEDMRRRGYTEEDLVTDGVPCLVLYPVN